LKSSRKMSIVMKRIGIWLLGFVLSIVSFSILIQINGPFKGADGLVQTIWHRLFV
jgi:hypothetical protein